MTKVKRLRIFAGPNGSGKSTIFESVNKMVNCPFFVNADQIEKSLAIKGKLSFDQYLIFVEEETLKQAFYDSGFYKKSSNSEQLRASIRIVSNQLEVDSAFVDSYFSAFVADFLRYNMLNVVDQFTVETVLSDARKLDYIQSSRQAGHRIYLYFIATKDPSINIGRVKQRVASGGHNVAEEKIVNRYEKALANAHNAMLLSDRAYFFDNSESAYTYLASFSDGQLEIKTDIIPGWFKSYILSHFPE